MRFVSVILIAVLLVSPAYAQWVQTLDCDELMENKDIIPRTEFEEFAYICFYGTGYDDAVNLTLENGDTTYSLDNVQPDNGVVSTVASGDTFFSGVAQGIYTLFVNMKDTVIAYSQDIVVTGSACHDCADEDPQNPHAEVPEFGTVAALAVLAGAGLFIQKRRSA